MTRHFLLQCLARPKPIIVGYLAQYLIKPVLGFIIAKVLPDDELRAIKCSAACLRLLVWCRL